jgi:hypothetical protein
VPDVEEQTARELRRSGGRPRWDVVRVLGGVVRRQRRRAAIGGVLAVTALAGVAVAGVELLGSGAGDRTASPTPTVSLSPAEARLDALMGNLPYVPADAVFPDARHGYALVLSCVDRGAPQTCAPQLAATADGGATWVRRPLPAGAVAGKSIVSARLLALGPTSILVDDPGRYAEDEHAGDASAKPSPTAPPAWISGHRWFSPDGGRTWAARARRAVGTLPQIPLGSPVFFPPPEMPGGLDPSSEQAAKLFNTATQVLRPDGTAAVLTGGPAGDAYTDVTVTTAADGSVWIPGYRYDENDAIVARLLVSRDAGRSFNTLTLPKVTAPPSVYTADGRHVFLLEHDEKGVARLRRSIDGGVTWREVKVPAAGKGARGANTQHTIDIFTRSAGSGVSVAPTPDGGLLLTTRTALYRLAPGGTALTRAKGGAPVVFGLIPAGNVVLALGQNGGTPRFFVTIDGKTWKPFALK